jgi:hypothetical protein
MGQQVGKALGAHSGSIDGLRISGPQHLKEKTRQMRKKVFCYASVADPDPNPEPDNRVHMFLGLLDPDPGPSITKQK